MQGLIYYSSGLPPANLKEACEKVLLCSWPTLCPEGTVGELWRNLFLPMASGDFAFKFIGEHVRCSSEQSQRHTTVLIIALPRRISFLLYLCLKISWHFFKVKFDWTFRQTQPTEPIKIASIFGKAVQRSGVSQLCVCLQSFWVFLIIFSKMVFLEESIPTVLKYLAAVHQYWLVSCQHRYNKCWQAERYFIKTLF